MIAIAVAFFCAQEADAAVWQPQTTPKLGLESALNGVACFGTAGCFAVGLNGSNPLHETESPSSWTVGEGPSEFANLTHVACTYLFKYPCMSISENGKVHVTIVNTGDKWTSTTLAAPVTGAVLKTKGVDCSWRSPAPTENRFCMVTGSYEAGRKSLAETWDGSKWSVLSTPNGPGLNSIDAVSCVNKGSALSCTAVGTIESKPAALRWNGESWTTLPAPPSTATKISCTEANFCMAAYLAGASVRVETWNGVGWSSTELPLGSLPAGYTRTLTIPTASCSRATFCQVVFSEDQFLPGGAPGQTVPLADGWNGTSWEVQHLPTFGEASPVVPSDVSCLLTGFTCTAVGSAGSGVAKRPWAARYE